MANTNTLNSLFQYGNVKRTTKIRLPPKEADQSLPFEQLIGIEIEVEGITSMLGNVRYWEPIEDGSLRNGGWEFRTLAFPVQHIEPVVSEFYDALKATNPNAQFSDRTSIHMHLDFRERTVEELFKLCLLYAITEPCLFKFSSPHRLQSTFCVPLRDCMDVKGFQYSYHLLKKQGGVLNIEQVINFLGDVAQGKYAAINLINLQNHRQGRDDGGNLHTGCGSVEFRHLQGTDDPKKVILWGKLLTHLLQACQLLSLPEVERYIFHLNSTSEYNQFLERVFQQDWRHISPVPYTHKLFSEGVSLAKSMIIGKDKKHTTVEKFIPSPLIHALQKRISQENDEQEGREVPDNRIEAVINRLHQERVNIAPDRWAVNWDEPAMARPVDDQPDGPDVNFGIAPVPLRGRF